MKDFAIHVWSLFALCITLAALPLSADDFDEAPIRYRDSAGKNVITELQKKIDAGTVELRHEPHTGYLRAIMNELNVSIASQTLVFSKTSLQRHKISPETPRALYFNDDVYLGYCRDSDVMEISAVDPELGTVFYTLDHSAAVPKFERQADNCLICHASSQTRQVPGHMVRSVYVDAGGLPMLALGSHRIDHSSPLAERWGGWYVTGTHGEQKHLGNLTLGRISDRREIDNTRGHNLTSLQKQVDLEKYLSPHSDLIALMVLEHQGEAHNRLTRANFACRTALYQEQELNRELKKPADHRWESTTGRIRSAAEDLVRYFLYCEEAPLTSPLKGTTDYAAQFEKLGPFDLQGRSLRQFDLERRMMKYPCSHLIYSAAFDALPAEIKAAVYSRMGDVLFERDTSAPFAHLSSDDRRAIREILLVTKKDFPADWK